MIDSKDNNSTSHVNDVKVMLKYPPFYLPLLSVMNAVIITVSFGTTVPIYTTEQVGNMQNTKLPLHSLPNTFKETLF